jgi:hypothetical protein
MPGAKRQEAGPSEPVDCRRWRASLYQPLVVGIENKAADGYFDADHGFAFEGVGRPAH